MIQVELKIKGQYGIQHSIRRDDDDFEYYHGLLSGVLNIGSVIHKPASFHIEVEYEEDLERLKTFDDFNEFVIINTRNTHHEN